MTDKKLGRALMAIGALEDLARIIKIGKAVTYQTLPDRILTCTEAIIDCLDLESTNTPLTT